VDVKAALRKGASFVAVDTQGLTGLALACQREPGEDVAQVIDTLLRKRCPVSLCDTKGWNALHHACVDSSAEVVQLLIAADKSAAVRVTDTFASCLLLCSKNKSVVKIATLVLASGCNINAADVHRRTARMRAAKKGRLEMLAFLISRRAYIDARDVSGSTALHWACFDGAFGREAIALLCGAGANVMAKDLTGFTAFERALKSSGAMAEAMVPFLPA
jgi:ankyrin repeat protein